MTVAAGIERVGLHGADPTTQEGLNRGFTGTTREIRVEADDPRALATPYRWFRISTRRIQARREVNEMPDRELMRDGRWLV
jgi:hypothetical protein